MPVVRINDATFADLSALKTWFGTKTPSETIDRVVRDAMEELGMERDGESEDEPVKSSGGAIPFEAAPALAFTKPHTATINGKALHKPRWSSILLAVIEQLRTKGFEGKKLAYELAIPAREGQYEEEGFRYHPDLGISVQGQSAPDCWKEADRLAKKWRIPVVVEFSWRQNSKAQYPGKSGVLTSGM